MVCNAGEYYWFWLLWGAAARFWLRRDCQSENCLFPFRGYFPSAHQSKDVRPQWRITTKPYSLEMEKWIIEYTTAQFSSRYLNGTHFFLKWDFSLSIIDKSDFFFLLLFSCFARSFNKWSCHPRLSLHFQIPLAHPLE